MLVVVSCSALGTRISPGDTFDHCFVVDSQFDNGIKRFALLVQQLFQGRSLSQSARETIQNETVLTIRLIDPLRNDAHHHFVRNQFSCLDQGLRLLSDWRTGLHRFTQHFTCRELDDSILAGDQFGLRTLARARRPQQD